jgi:hypothetical protein
LRSSYIREECKTRKTKVRIPPVCKVFREPATDLFKFDLGLKRFR